MKRIVVGVGAVSLLAALLVAVGPKAVATADLTPVELNGDVEEYIARKEHRVPGIKAGTEKHIVWAGGDRSRTAVSLVYVHGLSATRQEVAPLCDSVATRLGMNLFYTRLAGHGLPGEAMGEPRAQDWLNDVREAVAIGAELGNRVVLVGTSTGATLAVWFMFAAPNTETARVGALILLSPNFHPADQTATVLLWPWGKQIATIVSGAYREWEPHNRLQGEYWTTRYPIEALVTMMTVVNAVERSDPGELSLPVLIATSGRDQVVDEGATRKWFGMLGSPDKNILRIPDVEDPAGHILAGEIMSPGTTARMAEELESFLRAAFPELDS